MILSLILRQKIICFKWLLYKLSKMCKTIVLSEFYWTFLWDFDFLYSHLQFISWYFLSVCNSLLREKFNFQIGPRLLSKELMIRILIILMWNLVGSRILSDLLINMIRFSCCWAASSRSPTGSPWSSMQGHSKIS